MGAVKGAPLYETFCVFPPAGGDQVGEAVGTHGAWARILIRAPPTMACGTIRRVVLENKKNQKAANTSTAEKKQLVTVQRSAKVPMFVDSAQNAKHARCF